MFLCNAIYITSFVSFSLSPLILLFHAEQVEKHVLQEAENGNHSCVTVSFKCVHPFLTCIQVVFQPVFLPYLLEFTECALNNKTKNSNFSPL